MNERIKELYEQATTWALDNYPPPVNTFMWEDLRNKKFAESIVGECMSTVLKESKWYWDRDEFESSNAIQNAARRLKEHFGVEE